jgi:putative SOS response-associated peptidase YedK
VLWDRLRTESGEHVLSCAVITMPANELLAEIHNAKHRMPLILRPEAVVTWLTGTPEQAKALLQPFPSELTRAHCFSKRVNTPRSDGSDLLMPAEA